jgi:hypothetical protein
MYCQTLATVSAVELLMMTTISANARPAGDQLSCELVAGHQGNHMAFAAAAQDGDQWWWLRWDGQPSGVGELVQIDPCDAELPRGPYADDCVLPQGHPGPHSFDLPAAPGSAISSEDAPPAS